MAKDLSSYFTKEGSFRIDKCHEAVLNIISDVVNATPTLMQATGHWLNDSIRSSNGGVDLTCTST
jgi:hypothetical protein